MAPSEPRRSPFRERLGTYLLGVAIGCMLVGFILYGRYQENQRRAAIQAARQSAPPDSK